MDFSLVTSVVVSFVIFVIAIVITFYIPGTFFVRTKKLPISLRVVLSFVVGLVLWGFQGYFFGYLNMRFASYLYICGVLFFAFIQRNELFSDLQKSTTALKYHKLLMFFILIGVLVQLLPVVGSGLASQDGMRFFGVNGKDGIMHLAYIRSIIRTFPPEDPGAAGVLITNYHYWSDLIIADFIRIWNLPTSLVFFQLFPPLISVLTACSAYLLMRVLGFSKKAGWLAIFFLFFTGDLAYAIMIITRHDLSFTAPVIDNGVDQFLNMPNAFARPIFLTSLISFFYLIKEKTLRWQIITALLFSSLVGIKVYYGIFVILGLGIVTAFQLLKNVFTSKSLTPSNISKGVVTVRYLLVPLMMTLLAGMLIYFPVNRDAGGLLLKPFYWTNIFMGPEGLNLGFWYSLHQSSKSYNFVLFFVDILAIFLTLLCIHGTRILGMMGIRTFLQKKHGDLLLFLIPGTILFHFLGLFTLQSSGGSNTFNFFVVGTVVLSILAAAFLSRYHTHHLRIFQLVLIAFVLVLSSIRPVAQISKAVSQVQQPEDNSVLIPHDELLGLEYIKNNSMTSVVVQSHPTDPIDHETPYVSYFSDRSTYLSGVFLQQTHNIAFPEREKKLKELFDETGAPGFNERARGMGIHFIFLKKIPDQKLHFTPEKHLEDKVYENNSVVVYKIVYPTQ